MTPWSRRNSQHGNRRGWLGARGSLSARLAGAGQSFDVQVLRQGRQRMRADEARALGRARVGPAYVREVLLRVDDVPVVFARSVTWHANSNGPWRSLRGLGTRPLADVLFQRLGLKRMPLEFARFKPVSRWQRDVAQAWRLASGSPVTDSALPARRSVFTRYGAPLLVMEVFAAAHAPWYWPSRRGCKRPEVLTTNKS